MSPALDGIMFTMEGLIWIFYFANAFFIGGLTLTAITELATNKIPPVRYRLAAAFGSVAVHAVISGIDRLVFTTIELAVIFLFVFSYEISKRLLKVKMDLMAMYLIAGILSGVLYGGLFYYAIVSKINDDTYGLKVVATISAICWGILGYHAYFGSPMWKNLFWFQFLCIFLVGIFYQPETTNKTN